MIRNIVFDMGMVLLEWRPMQACLRVTGDAQKAQQVCEAVFTHPEWGPIIDGAVMTEPEYLAHAQKRLDTQELKDAAAAAMSNYWLDSLYPIRGMDRVVKNLLDKGYNLYILSNCGFRFHDFSYKIPYISQFKGLLISAEEGLLKPDEAIYHRLCDKFGLKEEECVFIDDLEKNIEGAKRAGMQGYCFADCDVAKLQAYLSSLD